MAIQWFPGHMNKAKKELEERLGSIDVVIEMLDARLPGSSANPMIARLARGKPALKVLNKQDLADPAATEQWLQWYRKQPGTQAIGLDASDSAPAQKLVAACRELAPNRGGIDKPLRVVICGIPNVGKSTLINSLMGKRIAKTGNEPGITKGQQRIMLADDIELFDTPGMLWPKIIVPQGGFNLAASGAVGRNALDEEEVVLELLLYLMKRYATELDARYKVGEIADLQDWQLLELIGKKRGAVLSGGRINIQKAAEIVLTDFRDGNIGRISLERPEEWAAWEKAAKEHEVLRAAQKENARLEREEKKKGVRK
ncbi:ribosome biogenesis GTPase YlqF [Vogesella sp. LIG4]|uniref:ribosome biogenesis GTPase YlqF n=1 Tax=Vogesella sp. LIG4 TaxID=1192162 RepID=UPI00081FDB56|nr:ribosome biogenesis GTPase YlqF [Vogesella sp. LIG4]SCK16247.1 ribosome biogenesis GTPase A [Vogesella sp. LIG4]